MKKAAGLHSGKWILAAPRVFNRRSVDKSPPDQLHPSFVHALGIRRLPELVHRQSV